MRAKRGSLPFFVLTLLLSGPLGTQEPASKPLLLPTHRKGSERIEPRRTVIQQRRVLVDLSQLKNKRLLLPLFDGAEVVLVRDEKESGQSGAFVWEGEVEGQPGSWAILANVKEVLEGDVMTRDQKGAFAFYQIRYLGDRVHVLNEVDQSKFPAEEERARQGLGPSGPGPRRPRSARLDFLLAAARSDRVARSEGTRAPAAPGLSPAPPIELDTPVPVPTETVCEDPASPIDVLVVYTEAARREAGGTNAMVALIESAVRSTNRSYAKSEVTQRIRLVHKQKVEYEEIGDPEIDLERLQNTSDRQLDEVLGLRNDHAADAVVLLVRRRSDKACGWSNTMETVSHDFESSAYAVVGQDCASIPTWSFAHELGHVMGARHNRGDDDTEGKPFGFNHGLVVKSPTKGSPWRTIMAKDPDCQKDPPVNCARRIPRWSNPDILYPDPSSGDPTGNRITNNHRALEITAATVANFRCGSR